MCILRVKYKNGYKNQSSKFDFSAIWTVLAWHVVTDFSRDKQGVAIALSLPDDNKNKIQEKVFSQIGLDEFKKEKWT